MNRSISLVLTLASGFALSAAAQTPAAPAPAAPAGSAPAAPAGPAKIAVIAFQLAVAQTNEGQRNFAELQKKYEPKETQLKTLNTEIETSQKELQEKGATLTAAERTSRTKSIDEKKKQLQRSAEDLRTAGNQEMQDMLSALAAKVYDVLTSYSQQQGFTLVLDVSQQQNPVLYAGESTNITKDVIEAYNVKSGIPVQPPIAGATSAAPKPASKAPASH
jgi:outer membrane protein